MNESVKKWLEEKRAELAGRRDVAIFIEAKDVLDAIEQLSKPRLFSDSRLVESLRWQYSECETRKQFLRKVLTEQFKFVGPNANCPEPQNTDSQVERGEPEKQDKISPKTQAWMALLDGLVGLDV